MKFLSGVAAIAIAASLGAPALARDTFVQDGASMFGS
jgi:hypothetical protein